MAPSYAHLLLIFCCFSLNQLIAQDSLVVQASENKNSGFLDFNGYYDSREFSVLTINALANMTNRFQYFSLTNYQGDNETSDLHGFYSEQNLRWKISENSPFDLTSQWVIRGGRQNDDLRFGVRIRVNDINRLKSFFKKLNLSYSANFHLLELSESHALTYFPQLEHVYSINILPKILKNRVYIAGFADQNIVKEQAKKTVVKWVSEHQIGVMILKQLYVVCEYRINDFLPSNNYGFGYGIEYKIKF